MGAGSPRHDPVTTSIIMDVMTRWLTRACQSQEVLGRVLSVLDAKEGTDSRSTRAFPRL